MNENLPVKSRLFHRASETLPIADHSKGIYIWDTNGKRYIDGSSGAFAANLGHAHPRIKKAAAAQMEKISFAYRTQFYNRPALDLADLLTELSPGSLGQVFLVNSGSEAVESCIKLARQYWWSKGRPEKAKIISREPSYHGSTLGALSLTSYRPLNEPFEVLTVDSPKVPAPFCYHCPYGKSWPSCKTACAHALQKTIDEYGADTIAAFVTEPIGGASTGGAVPPDTWFPIIAEICRKNDILLIVDEVLTGCGRTGKFYGFQHWDIVPDIVALAKGLGAGYTTIGACIAREDVVDAVLEGGGFLHGHTMAANPQAAAIAREVLLTVTEEGLVENARDTGAYMLEKLDALKKTYAFIGDVRGRGLLAGVEFVQDRQARKPFPKDWQVAMRATEIAREEGLIIYPRRSLFGVEGDHISLAPPLIVTKEQIDEIISLLDTALSRLAKELNQKTKAAE